MILTGIVVSPMLNTTTSPPRQAHRPVMTKDASHCLAVGCMCATNCGDESDRSGIYRAMGLQICPSKAGTVKEVPGYGCVCEE